MAKKNSDMRILAAAAALALASFGTAHAAVVAESGDAGQLIGTAQVLPGGTTAITGAISDILEADLFRFMHGGGPWGATTVATGGTLGDSQLFLFDALGNGIIFNDDLSTNSNRRSSLSLADLVAGTYFLGISGYDADPVNGSSQELFPDTFEGQINALGRGTLAGWNFTAAQASGNSGTYRIDLRTATVPLPGTLALLLAAGVAGAVIRRR